MNRDYARAALVTVLVTLMLAFALSGCTTEDEQARRESMIEYRFDSRTGACLMVYFGRPVGVVPCSDEVMKLAGCGGGR